MTSIAQSATSFKESSIALIVTQVQDCHQDAILRHTDDHVNDIEQPRHGDGATRQGAGKCGEPFGGYGLTDSRIMRRMGRNQQLVRHFRAISMLSFAAVAKVAWELGLFVITPGLRNGGRPGLLYTNLWNFVGFLPIYLSMAEMASMAPISGAQYHWVSEFAPHGWQRLLSYVTGWTSTVAWQTGHAVGVLLVGQIIRAIIFVNKPEFDFAPWRTTLFAIGAAIFALLGNVFTFKSLLRSQNAMFMLHVMAVFIVIVPLWSNGGEKATHAQVWTEFENFGGWSSMPLSLFVGQLTAIYNMGGFDIVSTACHMAEEVRNATRSVPIVILSVYLINFILVFPAIVTFCYHMPSVADALAEGTGFPTIYVLKTVMSDIWVTIILAVTVALLSWSNIMYLTGVSRDLFAISQDGGVPFSPWMAKVNKRCKIPVNACVVTSAVSCLLALLYLGCPTAVYSVLSLHTIAILQSYILSIGSVLWRRIKYPETLPPAYFPLGRLGVPVNIIAVIYAVWAFFWSFWPQETPVTASGFNWGLVLFWAVVLVAFLYFLVVGYREYREPVSVVAGRRNS